jgi:DNA excision repair protein ERCC-2
MNELADESPEPIQVGVRLLVEGALRTGDLSIDRWESVGPVEAIRAHQKIQRRRPPEYTSELPVSLRADRDDRRLAVVGRIDGVFDYRDWAVVEEIKTTRRDLDALVHREDSLHWAQAKVYSHILLVSRGLSRVETQLTYCHLDSGEVRELRRAFSNEELAELFSGLVSRYLNECEEQARWIELRNRSSAALEFPYGVYRPGQRALAVRVYRAIRDGRQLLAQAPTGIGKTVAALFPAVKALGERKTDRLFFLTARTTGQSVPDKALVDMRRLGLRIRSVQLTAKEKICFNPERACHGDDCLYARGYYDRVTGAIDALLGGERMNRERIEEVASQHRVCPFELSIELARRADCIIGDYNYAFDPHALLRGIVAEGKSTSLSFIVDEAHNLVDRARDMFSAVLESGRLLSLGRRMRGRDRRLSLSLGKVNAWMRRTRRQALEAGGFLSAEEPPGELLPPLRRLATAAESVLGRLAPDERDLRASTLELLFDVMHFLRVAEAFDECYVACYQAEGETLGVKLFCLDPAARLRERLSQGRPAVFLSATLAPSDYFREVFGCSEDADRMTVPSPFPPGNLRVVVMDGVSTRYRDRPASARQVGESILAFVRQRLGNYLVFFPSYEYLSMVLDPLLATGPEFQFLVQTPGMGETERSSFLGEFREAPRRTMVGLAVMGGIFGEAIDLVGDRLTGAAIVGVGLPGISPERDLIRRYYTRRRGNGFDYAYGFPGINRVLQAAGRVIRSETDRGAVLLVDRRFTQSPYRRLLPREWRPVHVQTVDELELALAEFWGVAAVVSGARE